MRRFCTVILLSFCLVTFSARAQYKEMEGILFEKVMGLGAGGSFLFFSDPKIGLHSGITAIHYSIVFSKKFILSTRLAFHKPLTLRYEGIEQYSNAIYTQDLTRKLTEYAFSARFAITADGLEKHTSVFALIEAGSFLGKKQVVDSRFGATDKPDGESIFGAGLSIYQQVLPQVLLFVDPSYRLVLEGKLDRTYLGDNNEKRVRMHHVAVQCGLLFLIGKRQE